VLQQNTLGLGVTTGRNAYQHQGIVDPTKPFALTVIARVLAQEGDPTDPFGFGFGVVMGTEQFALGLRTTGIFDASGATLSTTIDTTQFHTYHLEGAPGLGFRVFVDGVLLGTGATSATSAPPFLLFGDLSDTANAQAEVKGFSFVQHAGLVIRQTPAAGDAVPEGTSINLTIVKAPAAVTVPNVVGQTEANAKAALIAATLLVGTITQENSDTVPAGNVISQTPTAGTSVPELTVVNLVVSKGPPPPQTVTVPNLVGLTQAAATQALTTATLKAGTITQASSPTVPAGNVISQTPVAGASVPKDSAVDFVVSLGPPPPPPTDLASILVQPANPLILTTQTQAFTAIGILSDGSSTNLNGQVTWASSTPAIASITNSGVAISGVATGLAEGTTTISATAGSITGSTILTVKASVTDGILPIATITAPANDTTITSPVDVIGTASDANFLKYILEYAPVGESTFTTIVTGTTAVTNGVLGKLDPTLLLNDLFTLRLTVIDRANNQTETSIQVQVAREQKVGNFTLAFQDLSVPVAGLPITVVRTYDSRDKGKGDFGIGWRLDIQTLRLKVTGVMGANWQQNQSGGVLNRRYDLVPTTTHKVSITLPDGKVEEFDFTPTPTSQPLAPIEVVTAGYTPRALTRGRLRALGETSLVTFGVVGPLDLLLESDPSVVYDPQTFEYTTPEGQVITIDRTAGVQKVRDLNGNTLTFGPNGIIHSAGKSITFIRDAQQRITQITDPKGNTQSYTYDANGDLKSHTDPAGNTTSFLYNFRHDLIEIKDPRGIRPVRNEYDDAGRLVKHIDAFGKEITYTHNIGVREEIITDRLGNVTKHEYDDKGNVVRTTDANGGTTERTYDTRGNTLTEKDPLNRTRTYTYDANDNRTSEADPLGNTTGYTYNGRNQVLTISQPGSGTTTNTYDANGNLTSTKDPSGKTTTYTYNAQGLQLTQTDPLGNVTTYSYDGVGNLLTETNPLNHVTTYTYDANGNRLTQTTTNNGQTLISTFQYDALNRLVKTTFPDGSTSQTVYNSIGKQNTTTDQGGRQTSYQYDDLGRLTKTTYPDGTSESSTYDAEGRRLTSTDRGGRVTTYSYDALGRLVTATAPDSSSTSTTYDPAGQVTATTDALGRGTMYEYDLAGRRTKVTDAVGQVTTFTYDAAGNQKTVTDAKGNVTTFSYDANNRRTGVSYADGTGESTVYDALGRTASKTDQGGRTTTFTYDALGRLLTVTDALNQVTQYTYDDLGNQLTQTDANGRTTTFAYDKLGRRTQRTLPAGQTETYVYNAAGNLTGKTDFNGKVTTFTYDAVNRLLSKTPDPTLGEPTVTFSYTSSGQRASMSDASGTTSYTYDNRDRLISKATPQGTLTYTYDLAGNLLSTDSSNANGVSVDYAYDTLNRLSTVDDTRLTNGVTTYTYDNVGNLESYLYPNGVQSQYTYNTLNRLTNLTISKAATLASFAYTLGAAGNRTSVTDLNGRTASYSYDPLYRLTNETITGDPTGINGSIGYTYDPVGNRKTRASTVAGVVNQTFTYDANDRLNTDTYDPNGNTTSSDGKTYNYDFENHLTDQNGGGVVIVYDGDGNRVAKTVGGVTTRYLIDDHNHTGYAQVLEEIVGGVVQRRYTYGLDLISQNQGSGVSFYGYDGHGSVRFLTDASGAVTDTYTHEAFGNLIASTGTTPNNYLYTGEQSDPNLGFYYLRARYLSHNLGRFVTADPFEGTLEDPCSLQKYVYAKSNLPNRTDPSGLFSIAELTTIASIVGSILPPHITVRFGGTKKKAEAVLSGVYVQGHAFLEPLVGFAYYLNHSSIRIVLTAQEWSNAPRPWLFRANDPQNFNHYFVTLGAGGPGGVLVSALFRSLDVNKPKHNRHRIDLGLTLEERYTLIERLFEADSHYQDSLPYVALPNSGFGYNSNSYTSGLVQAAGENLFTGEFYPFEQFYPGWSKPVPRQHFQ
jgi:RHS repeat-associated protein